MGRRAPARGRARGGEGIPASRADRARLGAGGLAAALVAATGAWLAVVAEEGYLARWTLFATLVGVACVGGAVVLRRPGAIPFGVAAVTVPYLGILTLEQESLHAEAPVLAAALFGAAELAYWSLELRGGLADEAGTYLRRLALVAGLCVGVFVAGTVVLALVADFTTRGATVDVIGTAAALVALALLALAAASRRAG